MVSTGNHVNVLKDNSVVSKNSAELEIVICTVVAAVWTSTFQLLDFTNTAAKSGRLPAHDRVSNAVHATAYHILLAALVD